MVAISVGRRPRAWGASGSILVAIALSLFRVPPSSRKEGQYPNEPTRSYELALVGYPFVEYVWALLRARWNLEVTMKLVLFPCLFFFSLVSCTSQRRLPGGSASGDAGNIGGNLDGASESISPGGDASTPSDSSDQGQPTCTPNTSKRCASNGADVEKCNSLGTGWAVESTCPAPANGTPSCVDGVCGDYSCNEGFNKCADGSCRLECPSIEWIRGFPTEALPCAINTDGSAFVAYSHEGAAKWTIKTGVGENFDLPSEFGFFGKLIGISDDGRYTFGHVLDSDGLRGGVNVWDGSIGSPLSPVDPENRAEADGIAATGDYVFGRSYDSVANIWGYNRWTRANGTRLKLFDLDEGYFPGAEPFIVSSDGRAAVFMRSGKIEKWTSAGISEVYPAGRPIALSSDGSQTLALLSDGAALALIANGRAVDIPRAPGSLPWLFGSWGHSGATGGPGHVMSDDASKIVGAMYDTQNLVRAIIWLKSSQSTKVLRDYMVESGVDISAQESLAFQHKANFVGHFANPIISRNGRVIVGRSTGGIYRIVLP